MSAFGRARVRGAGAAAAAAGLPFLLLFSSLFFFFSFFLVWGGATTWGRLAPLPPFSPTGRGDIYVLMCSDVVGAAADVIVSFQQYGVRSIPLHSRHSPLPNNPPPPFPSFLRVVRFATSQRASPEACSAGNLEGPARLRWRVRSVRRREWAGRARLVSHLVQHLLLRVLGPVPFVEHRARGRHGCDGPTPSRG